MNKKQYEVTVLVNGRPVKEYSQSGNTFIEGKSGSNYSINIKNNSHERIKAVITVDSQNVISDNDPLTGYIINPYSSIKIKGFRTSENTESLFTFCDKRQSRAKKAKGSTENCGVIGVLIYKEKAKYLSAPTPQPITPIVPVYPYPYPYKKYDVWASDSTSNVRIRKSYGRGMHVNSVNTSSIQNSVNTSCNASSNIPDFTLGTKMGEDVQSPVKYTSFQSGPLDARFDIYYSSKARLKKAGILNDSLIVGHMPQAFDFCKKY